ncbi:MAG TPA: hypothetical protein VMC08_10690 [Bacteroidales bacterium]|nr:hypothetical protein [Bacteroidales bacterium]
MAAGLILVFGLILVPEEYVHALYGHKDTLFPGSGYAVGKPSRARLRKKERGNRFPDAVAHYSVDQPGRRD